MEHEYVLLAGVNRAKVGRYIGVAASGISAIVVMGILAIRDIAKELGVDASIPPTFMSLASAATIFLILYWLFDNFALRAAWISRLLKVPYLAGTWSVSGMSYRHDDSQPTHWAGDVTIVQSWDKLRIRLKTAQSGSNSVVAAVMHDEVDGYQLIYNYKNDPKINEVDLQSHVGFSRMTINKDLCSAEGSYINGHGRATYGTMNWERK